MTTSSALIVGNKIIETKDMTKEQKAALARLLQKRLIESFYDDVIVDDEGAEEILRNI